MQWYIWSSCCLLLVISWNIGIREELFAYFHLTTKIKFKNICEIVMNKWVYNSFKVANKVAKILTFSNLILLEAVSVNSDYYYSNDSWDAIHSETSWDTLLVWFFLWPWHFTKMFKIPSSTSTDKDDDAVLYCSVKSPVIFWLKHKDLVNVKFIQLRRTSDAESKMSWQRSKKYLSFDPELFCSLFLLPSLDNYKKGPG